MVLSVIPKYHLLALHASIDDKRLTNLAHGSLTVASHRCTYHDTIYKAQLPDNISASITHCRAMTQNKEASVKTCGSSGSM